MSLVIGRWNPQGLRLEGDLRVEYLARGADGWFCWADVRELALGMDSKAMGKQLLRVLRVWDESARQAGLEPEFFGAMVFEDSEGTLRTDGPAEGRQHGGGARFRGEAARLSLSGSGIEDENEGRGRGRTQARVAPELVFKRLERRGLA